MITDCNIVNIENNSNLDSLLKEAFFIDIETTGLSKIYSDIISVTALLYENGCYKIHQVFCEYKMDEPEALKYLKDLINKKKYIITYNGNSFDIPFLAYKFQKHCINLDFDSFIKIDLYNWLRRLKNKIQVENLKLKSAEEYFNIKRNDCIKGKDVAVLYKAYKIDPRKEFSYLIMRHNYEDVFNLPTLLNSILDLYDDVLYYNRLIVKINSKDFKIKKSNLYCKFDIISDYTTDYIYPGINFNLNMNPAAQAMEISIPLSFFKDDKISEFYFVNNNEYKVKTYTAIKGIKKNLIPVKFNSKIFHNNIINILKKIMNSIF